MRAVLRGPSPGETWQQWRARWHYPGMRAECELEAVRLLMLAYGAGMRYARCSGTTLSAMASAEVTLGNLRALGRGVDAPLRGGPLFAATLLDAVLKGWPGRASQPSTGFAAPLVLRSSDISEWADKRRPTVVEEVWPTGAPEPLEEVR